MAPEKNADRLATTIPNLARAPDAAGQPRSLRVAIVGTRGIPANYGGFETFAEELGCRLVQRGHEVTVYGRSHYVPRTMRSHKGVRLVVLNTLRTKYLDTPIHTFLSGLHALSRRYDAVLMCNSANAIFLPLFRLRCNAVAINVDGLEWKRQKWNWLGRCICRLSERLSYLLSNALITDAKAIQDYYRSHHGQDSVFIPYGAPVDKVDTTEALVQLGVESRSYLIYASRFEPENNAHLVIDAYRRLECEMPLLMIGDAPYSKRYIRSLHEKANGNVMFPGSIYGTAYRELMSHAYCYIHATEVGGTHPGLLEGMGLGNGVLVSDTAENREVAGDGAYYFRPEVEELTERLRYVIENTDELVDTASVGRERIMSHYDWGGVADSYEDLLTDLAERVFDPKVKPFRVTSPEQIRRP